MPSFTKVAAALSGLLLAGAAHSQEGSGPVAPDPRMQDTTSVLLPATYWEDRVPIKRGDAVPNWTLPLAADSPSAKKGMTQLELSRWRGSKNTIVVFWAFWCDTWKDATAYFSDLHSELEKRDVKLVAVAVDASQQPVARPAFNSGKLFFPVAIDTKSETTARYGVRRVPTILLIAPDGKVREVWEGLPSKKLLLKKLKN